MPLFTAMFLMCLSFTLSFLECVFYHAPVFIPVLLSVFTTSKSLYLSSSPSLICHCGFVCGFNVAQSLVGFIECIHKYTEDFFPKLILGRV